MFVLDTNVISELRRPERAHPSVANWAQGMPVDQTYLSAITILELQVGALRIGRRDKLQGAILHAWIEDEIIPRFDARILPVTTLVALRCAPLHVPDPRSERDALIGATALAHGMTVVTHNVSDFAAMGVALLNPWEVVSA